MMKGQRNSDSEGELNESDASLSEEMEDENEDTDDEKGPEKGTSWSTVMEDILKEEPLKKRKCIILSKKEKEPQPIQDDSKSEEKPTTVDRKLWMLKGKLKPNVLQMDKEKTLQKTALISVVNLFNAVQEHQKKFSKDLEKAGNSELKKDAIMKKMDRKRFFEVLMDDGNCNPPKEKTEIKVKVEEESDNKIWEPLRSDFMIGSGKLKDWDIKES